ncbi:hypothetical protein XENOCAPTIV_017970, partial [Xenoophorus captivus]
DHFYFIMDVFMLNILQCLDLLKTCKDVNHLVVQSEEERVVLSFVSLSITDDLSYVPVKVSTTRAYHAIALQHYKQYNNGFNYFSSVSISSLANKCSLRYFLQGPHSPAHLLCLVELQTDPVINSTNIFNLIVLEGKEISSTNGRFKSCFNFI